MMTGPSTERPSTVNVTTSPSASGPPWPSRLASAEPIAIGLSHVTFVNGRGSSCSQALFAYVPSPTPASGRNRTATVPAAGVRRTGAGSTGAAIGRGLAAVSAMTPSCSTFIHQASKLPATLGRQ